MGEIWCVYKHAAILQVSLSSMSNVKEIKRQEAALLMLRLSEIFVIFMKS